MVRRAAALLAAAVLMLVAPAVYRADQSAIARVTFQRDKPLLERRVGDGLLPIEPREILVGRAALPRPAIVLREAQGSGVRSPHPPPPERLLWVGVDMPAAMAGGAELGAAPPSFEREHDHPISGSSPAGRPASIDRTRALSVVTGLLLDPAAAKRLSTLGRDILGGPEPRDDQARAHRVRVRPRFAKGGMRWEISWDF